MRSIKFKPVLTIQSSFDKYYKLIKKNASLQLDGELCLALRKTPSQIAQLEKDGFLSYEEKIFLWAFLRWRTEFQLENHVSLF